MKLIAYSLVSDDSGDRYTVSFGTSPRYANSIKGLQDVLAFGSLERREDLDDLVEQVDGMPSYPDVYESSHGPFVAVCKRHK